MTLRWILAGATEEFVEGDFASKRLGRASGRGASLVTGESDEEESAEYSAAPKELWRPVKDAELPSGGDDCCEESDDDCESAEFFCEIDAASCALKSDGETADVAGTGVAGDETGWEPTGLGPSGAASERTESEPGKRKAQEAKVKNDTLRFKRDALALRKRSVQLSQNWAPDEFTSGRREFGAGVSTIASPQNFGGAASIFALNAKKQRHRQQKRPFLGSRSKDFKGI